MARQQTATTQANTKRPVRDESRLLDEVVAVVCLTAAVFSFLSFYAYQGGPASWNLSGKVGEGLAEIAVQALGLASYLGPLLLAVIGVLLFRDASEEISLPRGAGALVLILATAVLLGLTLPAGSSRSVGMAGGWIGGFLATLLVQSFGSLGSLLIVGAVLILSFVYVTRVSLGGVAVSLGGSAVSFGGSARAALARVRENAAPAVEAPPRRRRTNIKKESAAQKQAGPVIVVREERELEAPAKKAGRVIQQELPFAGDDRYQMPPLRFLDERDGPPLTVDEEALHKSSQILETKLADFGIEGRVVAVHPGPVITTFHIEPAPGVKVNRIISLGDDLAMALRVPGVRILAPVPGKPVVGIEVANPKREAVTLRELLEAEAFVGSTSPTTLALGKDTAGGAVIGDLARMPHLMIAGATGSGKSVAINAMIMSILYKSTPRDLRFVMIDLKMLELSVYEDIPHLLVPVVTDPKLAVAVLHNIVELMEQRYRLMKQHGVRGIDGYNRLFDEEEGRRGGVLELRDLIEDPSEDGEDAEDLVKPPKAERLPKVVVVIDELADLMMTMGRKVEEPITRLAQKARAAGIHLLVATQRPSVDVITGLIKANFPSRISFQTTSRVDSRTILDHIGAERLLGRGDLLFLPPGSARLQRLHGPLVTEGEIHRVVEFIKRQGSPHYLFDLLEVSGSDDPTGVEEDLEDELYDQAVRLVTESRQASISWVQRRLRIGYNRAARMIERMEREGVVSSSEGGRPREVLVPPIAAD